VLLGIGFRAARRPLAWYDEVASVLLACSRITAAALAALKNAHIGFPGRRTRWTGWRFVVLVVREAAVLGFFAVLAWEEPGSSGCSGVRPGDRGTSGAVTHRDPRRRASCSRRGAAQPAGPHRLGAEAAFRSGRPEPAKELSH